MTIDILNSKGEKTGRSVDLADEVFAIKTNEHVVYLAVKAYLANQRQGTHQTKERWEVWRTTKKFKKQKRRTPIDRKRKMKNGKNCPSF
jgi:large subunit ribosomal protein L4